MGFQARDQHEFFIPGRGAVLWQTEVQGSPKEGDTIAHDDHRFTLLTLNDQGVRSHPRLTGREIASYCGIVVDIPLGIIPRLAEIRTTGWGDHV